MSPKVKIGGEDVGEMTVADLDSLHREIAREKAARALELLELRGFNGEAADVGILVMIAKNNPEGSTDIGISTNIVREDVSDLLMTAVRRFRGGH